MAARASRTENQDAIDTTIVGMLADPKEACVGIQELHFLPFNPIDKRTSLIYLDRKERGLRLLAVTYQEVLEGRKESDKETGRCLGMGTNMYSSSALLGQNKDESTVALPVNELKGKADDSDGIFPEHKYEMIKCLQIKNVVMRSSMIVAYMNKLLED